MAIYGHRVQTDSMMQPMRENADKSMGKPLVKVDFSSKGNFRCESHIEEDVTHQLRDDKALSFQRHSISP